MTKYVMRLVGLAGKPDPRRKDPMTKQQRTLKLGYLSKYRPAAWGQASVIETTDDPQAAHRFDNAETAWMLWKMPMGKRDYDGQPNRPLAAWTVSIEPIEIEEPA